ncbi:MAG: T9SS type A sorting domain-containing protein [Chlorobi bacterium]|nr:T9SS type A sorting domain-containing protein [Chlorobiota bacterium]
MKHLLLCFLFVNILYSGLYAQQFSVNTDSVVINSGSDFKSTDEFLITHSHSQGIVPGNTALCNKNLFHYENSYFLVYDLQNDFNLNGDWLVQNLEFAVEDAEAGNNISQPLIIKLWVMSDYNHHSFIQDSLTLLVSDTISVSDTDSGTLKNIEFNHDNTVSEGKVLVVEFLLPDGTENNNLLFLGSNNDRYSDSTYIRAPHCGVAEPVNVSEILFPDMMLIANIYGQYLSPNPEILSFHINGQITDTQINNDPDYTVKVVMPADTVLNALVPDIQIPAGFQVTPASGDTVDFSSGPVTYTVDNNLSKVTKSWAVSVVKAGPDIINASLPEQQGQIVINNTDFTVTIPVLEGSDLSNLSPTIYVYDGFTVTPASGTSQDFSAGPVTYTVSHNSLPITQDWQVSVFEVPAVTSVEDLYADKIKIFPNPANTYFFIEYNELNRAEIFNITGKKIIDTSDNKISVSDFPDGIYFLKIYSNNKVYNKKIMIIH